MRGPWKRAVISQWPADTPMKCWSYGFCTSMFLKKMKWISAICPLHFSRAQKSFRGVGVRYTSTSVYALKQKPGPRNLKPGWPFYFCGFPILTNSSRLVQVNLFRKERSGGQRTIHSSFFSLYSFGCKPCTVAQKPLAPLPLWLNRHHFCTKALAPNICPKRLHLRSYGRPFCASHTRVPRRKVETFVSPRG